MWRAYGQQGNGAAIILRLDDVTPMEDSPFIFTKVVYGSAVERRVWLDQKIEHWCNIVAGAEIPNDDLYMATHILLTIVKYFALTRKHDGFSEEREWRLIYLPDRDSNGLMKSKFDSVVGAGGVEPKLKLKIEPMAGVFSESVSFPKLLDSILLGPSASSPLASASFVRMLKMLNKPELTPQILSSTIPLRPVHRGGSQG